jgi:exonuclease SbcC
VDDTAEAAPELDQARQRLTRALAAEREADQALQSARSERAMKAANHADLVEELGARAEADAASLTQALETAEQEVTRLQSLADGLSAARAEYQAAENEHQNAETALKAAETAWYSASREQAAAQSAHDAALAELPEDLRTRAALDARLDAARTQQTELEQALETARQQKDAAEREETAAAQDAQSTESHYQEAIAGAEKADADFRRGLETAGFDTEEAYHAARADHAEIEALRAEVTDHDRKLDAAQNRIAELDTQIQERVRPDVHAHADAYEAARQALDNANAAVTLAQERLATDQGRVTRLQKIEAQIAETQEQLARVGRMARVARGDNPLGLSFERYVMTELLDAILASATQRLALMSRGRYALVRAEDTGDRRKHRGLDIAVHDDHTGKVRPASTLSGGEGFLASLALALGTSDVVQARSGGVKIDALYIDEGFGALDSETLDEAMRVILDLQRQSDRVIGMISHVSEMRERIPARLEVRSDRAGSTVHVRLP